VSEHEKEHKTLIPTSNLASSFLRPTLGS